MNYIRLGIAGVGNMGYGHLNNITDGQCPRIEVIAVSDPDTDMLKILSLPQNALKESFTLLPRSLPEYIQDR